MKVEIGIVLDFLSLLMPIGFGFSVMVLMEMVNEYVAGVKSFSPFLISIMSIGQTMFLIGAFAFVIRRLTEPYL